MTPRQQACLAAVRRLTNDGVSPSYQEIADEIGASSKGEVHRLIGQLEGRGHIRRLGPRRARCIEVMERAGVAAPAPDPDKVALALIAERLLSLSDRARAVAVIADALAHQARA